MKHLKPTADERGEARANKAGVVRPRDLETSVPKHVGFELELGNHLAEAGRYNRAVEAARALVAAHHRLSSAPANGDESLAGEFDEYGFRFYLDHEHAEISSPLVPSATQLVLTMRKARTLVARCARAAEKEVGPIRISYNNTNRQGVGWAFHQNMLVSRKAFDRWREADWKPLLEQWVPFLVTSLPLVGTGKMGVENGARDIAFQFSQRADFIEELAGLETVTSKTLINTRDEALADPARYARFHIIAWDTNLAEFASWLKFGISQILLALIEEEVPMPDVALKKPVQAMQIVSRDLKLRKRLRLRSGRRETALGVQRRLAEAAARAIKAGCAASQVPDAERIVEKWIETLDDLDVRRSRLNRRLDWCAKLDLLRRTHEMGATGRSRMMMLDLQYAELGGLFERLEQAGAVDRLQDFVPEHALALRASEFVPREQARAALVHRFGRHLARVDWDHAVSRDEAGGFWFIPMEDPLDGRDLLRLVTSAEDWEGFLGQLIRMEVAHPVALCAVVCEDHPIGPARPEETVLI